MSNQYTYPYKDLLPDLIDAIFSTLLLLSLSEEEQQQKIKEENKDNIDHLINSYFFAISKKFGKEGENRHLTGHRKSGIEPIYSGSNKKHTNKNQSRIGALVKNIYQESQSTRVSAEAEILPSPLFIASKILTAPYMQESSAYALFAVRSYLFEQLKLLPDFGYTVTGFEKINMVDIKFALNTINTYTTGNDPFPQPKNKNSQYFLYHFLLALGYIHLRFADNKKRKQYCRSKQLFADKKSYYENKANKFVANFPNPANIHNLIWGNPVPIKGGDTVFMGGIKTNEENNLVIGIHGAPGVGKTTLCLAYAVSMAPLGVKTFFLSNEEGERSLNSRAIDLVSENLKRLSFFPKLEEINSWFACAKLDETKLLQAYIEKLKQERVGQKCVPSSNSPPKPPNIIVIDGIHQYFPNTKENTYPLYDFIKDCRSLNVIVVLTVSQKWDNGNTLDHLLDVVIDLNYDKTSDLGIKPQRLFTLHKTRGQISRGGTHLLHLSSNNGVKIVPQIPSQLDLKSHFEPRLAQTDIEIKVFKESKKILCRGSHILIYGQGSGGKAGLALRIALSPENTRGTGVSEQNKRALIISFLYPEKYYKDLEKIITQDLKNSSKNVLTKIEVECLYPGYLSPEDLYSKIMSRVEQAELEGTPYDAVIIDGLHNITLQFPRISNYDHFWALLYSALRRRDLTVISTHTYFVIGNPASQDLYPTVSISDDDIKPLLHAIVQAADIIIQVKKLENESDVFQLDFIETVFDKPQSSMSWHRKLCSFNLQGELNV